ncbi:hypothetical protein FQN50_000160 [Emmonsiellopsis sp. PD_5]|nr:hypothetical protein FQN50_000160 [Emmonsiellopsis sp. PD_5]
MDPPSQDASSNAITSYLRLLQRYKTTLPYGQLICVSASPNISTMAALLRLANGVGPFIAVLQVHADIIDDWSQKAARRLSFLARKYGFLIWEGGRVLNVQKRSGRHQVMSSEEINRDIDLARKRYTKGVVSVAAWAGMASSWVIGPEEQEKGGNRLIPTLRRAARETVAVLTMSVRTEISGGNEQQGIDDDSSTDGDELELERNGRLGDELSLPPARKASVISLTRTITQHTEPSTPASSGAEDNPYSDDEEDSDGDDTPTSPPPYPAPPLLARGLVLCLPAEDDPMFTHQYKHTTLAAARAHSDFVVGFTSNESWIEVSRNGKFNCPSLNRDENESDNDDGESNDKMTSDEQTVLLFAPLESDHILFPGAQSSDDETARLADSLRVSLTVNDVGSVGSSPRSSQFLPLHRASTMHHQRIHTLHQLIARAISVRDSISASTGRESSGRGRFEVLCVPVISMNA